MHLLQKAQTGLPVTAMKSFILNFTPLFFFLFASPSLATDLASLFTPRVATSFQPNIAVSSKKNKKKLSG